MQTSAVGTAARDSQHEPATGTTVQAEEVAEASTTIGAAEGAKSFA